MPQAQDGSAGAETQEGGADDQVGEVAELEIGEGLHQGKFEEDDRGGDEKEGEGADGESLHAPPAVMVLPPWGPR